MIELSKQDLLELWERVRRTNELAEAQASRAEDLIAGLTAHLPPAAAEDIRQRARDLRQDIAQLYDAGGAWLLFNRLEEFGYRPEHEWRVAGPPTYDIVPIQEKEGE